MSQVIRLSYMTKVQVLEFFSPLPLFPHYLAACDGGETTLEEVWVVDGGVEQRLLLTQI